MEKKIKTGTLLKALCLEDKPRDAEIMHERIIDAGYDLDMDITDSEKEFESLLHNSKYDIILSDFKLPGFDAFGALRLSNEVCPDVPFICVSGSIGEETAIELLKLGAVDYVLKDRPERLPFAINRALNEAKDKKNQQKIEEALRKSEQRFQVLAENSPFGIFRTDSEGSTTYVNPRWCQLSGLSKEEAMGYGWLSVVHNNDKQKLTEVWKDATAEHDSSVAEYRFLRKDGSTTWVHGQAIPERDDNNNVVGYIGNIIDITERKHSEELLQESEEKYRLLSESSYEAIFLIDLNGYVKYMNNTAAVNLGGQPAELIGKHLTELFPPETARENLAEIQTVVTTKCPFYNEKELQLPAGKMWVGNRFSPVLDKEKEVIAILGLSINITKQKMAETELRKISSAVEHSGASVVITNRDGNIEYVNQKFCDITGYSKEEALRKNPRILSSGFQDKNFYKELWNTILSGNDWSGELLNRKKNGGLFWESALISPLSNNDGEIINFVAIKEDITEKKIMLSQLIEAKEKAESANKLKDAFIANISHEIRTPLNGILGMTSIIKEEYQSNIKKEDEMLFEGIDYSSKRIIRTIDMILNYSRLQVGEFNISPKKVKISQVCTNLVKEFISAAKQKSLELSYQIDCGDMEIFADEYSITMAISNLIDNAIKFTQKGFINVLLRKGINNEIILEVKDTGIGIDKKYMEYMFEPYRQEHMGYGRAYEGIGLGLSIVKKVLNLNNAVITVESKKGVGTTFSINFGKGELIHENKSVKGASSKILHTTKDLQKKVVLVVEDDLMNQVTIKRFIENMYSIIVCDSSEDAMEIIKKGKVDLILMDISINGSRDGLELTKEIKASEEFSYIPIIAITAHAFIEDKQNALAAGCDDYLAKPFTKASLLNMIALYDNK
ncbi:MAG: PAS domain S-box protein [Ignavibacteriaceae bacterium]|nr:PAS domain S-box protein [Ignavibacteriaceae bacterium]